MNRVIALRNINEVDSVHKIFFNADETGWYVAAARQIDS